MTTDAATNYWTATAFDVAGNYSQDDYGVKYCPNPDPTDDQHLIPCEPYCTACGFPPHICDEYFTRCTGTIIGRWFDLTLGKWIETQPINTKTPEEEEDERSNLYKFGLCSICKIGIDDKSEFTFNYETCNCTPLWGKLICWDCHDKQTSQNI